MLYKRSTTPFLNTEHVKLGLAEAKYVFKRIYEISVEQINLFESLDSGFAAQSDATILPKDGKDLIHSQASSTKIWCPRHESNVWPSP